MSSLYLEYKIRKLLEKQAQTISQQLIPPPISQTVTGYRKQEVAIQRPFTKTPDVQMATSRDLGLGEEIMTPLPVAPLAAKPPINFQEEDSTMWIGNEAEQPQVVAQNQQQQPDEQQNQENQAPQAQAENAGDQDQQKEQQNRR